MAVVSLVFGILGFCFPIFIPAVVAIITGIFGRKKAKELGGKGAGMALGGIILGVVNLVLSIILGIAIVFGGLFLVKTATEQVAVAEKLQSAARAAQAYGALNGGDYSNLTDSELERFGFQPSSDVSVRVVPQSGGTAYCIEGNRVGEPGTVIHVPGSQVKITIGSSTYSYDLGSCPSS